VETVVGALDGDASGRHLTRQQSRGGVIPGRDRRLSGMSITHEHELAAEVQAWADLHGLPLYAPVAMAEQIAVDAVARGASPDEARDRAAAYLRSWYLHPANN
jgi:hypothetical protein